MSMLKTFATKKRKKNVQISENVGTEQLHAWISIRAVFICSMFCMFANQLCMQYPELAGGGGICLHFLAES